METQAMLDKFSFVCRLWRNVWTPTLKVPVRVSKSKTSLCVDSWKNVELHSIFEIRKFSCSDSLTRTTNTQLLLSNSIQTISLRTSNSNDFFFLPKQTNSYLLSWKDRFNKTHLIQIQAVPNNFIEPFSIDNLVTRRGGWHKLSF